MELLRKNLTQWAIDLFFFFHLCERKIVLLSVLSMHKLKEIGDWHLEISPLISFVCICLLFLFHNQRRYRLNLFIWSGYLLVLSCMNFAIYFADRIVCLVVSSPRGAVMLQCLEKAQFVVLSRAGFSLPALLVALPATPEAPPGRDKNVVLIYLGRRS